MALPNLAATLAERERSQRWLAKKIKVSPTLMFYVVTGERTIAADKAALASAVLGKNIEDLFVSTDMAKIDTEMELEAAVA